MLLRTQKQRNEDSKRFERVNKTFEIIDHVNIYDLDRLRN